MSLSSFAIMRFIVPLIRRNRPFPVIAASYTTCVVFPFGVKCEAHLPTHHLRVDLEAETRRRFERRNAEG